MLLRSSCTNCTSKRTNTREFMNGIQSSLRLCRSLRASWKDPDCAEIERSSTGSPIKIFTTIQNAQPVDEQLIQRFKSQPKSEAVSFIFPPKHNTYINPEICKPWCKTCAFENDDAPFDIHYFNWEVELETAIKPIVLINKGYPETSIYARRMRSLRETTIADSHCNECTEYLRLKRMVDKYSATAELQRSQIHHYTDNPYTKDSFAYLIYMYIRANMGYDWVSKLDMAHDFIDKRRKVHSTNDTSRKLDKLYAYIQKELNHVLLQDITVLRLQSNCDSFESFELEWLEFVFVGEKFD